REVCAEYLAFRGYRVATAEDGIDALAKARELMPDIIALGFDQKYDEAAVASECAKRGWPCRVVRLPHFLGDLDGTRKIIEKVAERAAGKTLYRSTVGDE
ncbi:MAG: hypothetical protein ABR562_02960, partial [Thermoplasmatota archaeon]